MDEESKIKEYNPKKGLEWVPAFLAIAMTISKCVLLMVPYLAASFLNNEQAAIMASIQTDESFNMVWITSVAYWMAKTSGQENK